MERDVAAILRSRATAFDGLVEVPCSVGELIDKITILEIKSERIADPAKLDNVRRELGLLRAIRAGPASLRSSPRADRGAIEGGQRPPLGHRRCASSMREGERLRPSLRRPRAPSLYHQRPPRRAEAQRSTISSIRPSSRRSPTRLERRGLRPNRSADQVRGARRISEPSLPDQLRPPRATRSISARTSRSTIIGRLSSSQRCSIGRSISRTACSICPLF